MATRTRSINALSIAAATGVCLIAGCVKTEDAAMPDKSLATQKATTEQATFAAGCFWGVEATFRNVEGVVSTSVGYTGGTLEHPTYEDVCTRRTGHAEAVRVVYDPTKISYKLLLDVFWDCHDPTTPNRQGPDIGSQYRSAIFYHTPEQQAAAVASKQQLQQSARCKQRVVTEITPARVFYLAEEYHQQYLQKRGKTSCSTTVR